MRRLSLILLLLLVSVVLVGCGNDKGKTAGGDLSLMSVATKDNTVVSGDSVVLHLLPANTDVVLPAAGAYPGQYKDFGLGYVNYTPPETPGKYDFAVKDKSGKEAKITITVTAKLTIGHGDAAVVRGNVAVARGTSQQFDLESSHAISAPTWSVVPADLGTITQSGLFAASAEKLNVGRIVVTATDTVTGKTLTAVTPVEVAEPSTANQTPPEVAGLWEVGLWGTAKATPHDPTLDGLSIPDNAYVYGGFNSSYAPIPLPETIKGYTKVTSIPSLKAGEFATGGGAFQYLIIIPLYEPPVEVAGLWEVGLWGTAKATPHDPTLDGLSVPDSAYVYGGFNSSYAPMPLPETIKGYTKKTDIPSLQSGEFATGGGAFQYLILVPLGFVD
jgi:hypothetical protein